MLHRIGVISDTHGVLRAEVAEAMQACEAILHGGDINCPEILYALREIAPTYAVRGNNDKEWAADLPETLSVELYGVHFFMVHNKKYLPQDTKGIDVMVYGHSHKYEEKYAGGLLLLNPGSCGPRRFTQPITYAVLEIGEDRSLRVKRMEIAHQAKAVKDSRKQTDTAKAQEHGSAGCDRKTIVREALECETAGLDMKKTVKAVMRDTNKKIPADKIAARNGISEELAEQICRLYLTHPGVSVEGILGKMGL